MTEPGPQENTPWKDHTFDPQLLGQTYAYNVGGLIVSRAELDAERPIPILRRISVDESRWVSVTMAIEWLGSVTLDSRIELAVWRVKVSAAPFDAATTLS
jgi:hypothetical protein